MILVTVGTTDFDDLVRKADEIAPTLDDKVLAQIGRGQYQPIHCEWFRFADSLTPYYERADIVVAHGGLGTVIEVASLGKRLIGVSNPDRFDHHQEDILRHMEKRRHLIWCKSLDELPDALESVRSQELTPYGTPECHIAEVIHDWLSLRVKGV